VGVSVLINHYGDLVPGNYPRIRGTAVSNGWSAHLVWLNLWAVLGVVPLCGFAIGCYRAMRLYRYELGIAVALGVMLLDGFARDIEDMRHLWV
jgi:hypothetical protein